MSDPVTVAVPRPTQVGQATAIEQSRAVAEVYAAIMVAQQAPRNTQNAITTMKESCAITELAERAFFRFPRAGGVVSGASVHLARELARCWGNIQYGVSELRRDDDAGESEMLAFAWDVQTNARSSTIFIVPHKRDKRGGPEQLTDMRDIYENNANAGARRMRECIFGVLPVWFVEEAKRRCTETVEHGGGKPLAQRIADMLAAFEPLGVTEDDLVRKLGRVVTKWTANDVAQMSVVFQSLRQGTVTKEDEFPPPRVTAEEITKQANTPPAAAAPPAVEHADSPPTRQDLLAAITRHLDDQGVEAAVRAEVVSLFLDDRITTLTKLTAEDARLVLDRMDRASTGGTFAATVATARQNLSDEGRS